MITASLLRNVPLLAEVPDDELGVIAARAADIALRPNDWLIQEGEVPAFFIVISGRLNVYKSIGGVEQVITHYGPGEYGGELPILLGSPAIAGLRAAETSRICRLDQPDFRELIVACPLLNAQLLQMMATRISGLQQLAIQAPLATVTIIGHRFDLACHALRDFLSRNHVAFRWYDPRDPEARVGLAPTPQADETFPVVRFADGSQLTTPSFRAVATRLGLQTTPEAATYDVAIVGAGPAGLAASVALFVFIGADAETSWLPEAIIRDERGYVCTGRDVMDLVAADHGHWPLERDPYLLDPAYPASSPSVMSATDPLSASHPAWAKAAWRSHSSTNTWRSCPPILSTPANVDSVHPLAEL